jgi:hypothetical protein
VPDEDGRDRRAGTAAGTPEDPMREAPMREDPHPLPPPSAWFAHDAERHLLDAPRHCPRCGARVSGSAGLVVEYWVTEDRVFYCWCRACDWTGTIIQLERHVGHEAAE